MMSKEATVINQNLTQKDVQDEGTEILPLEERTPSIEELDLDILRLNIEQRLFESIWEVGSTWEIDTHWLSIVLQNDYEKYLNFKLNKLGQNLFSFEKQEWVLDFKINVYNAWYKLYERQRDLRKSKIANDELLSENEIEDACFNDLIGIRNESKARIELQIPLNNNLNRVSLPDSKVLILGDMSESEEDHGEFFDQVFDKAESELKAYLLDITKNWEYYELKTYLLNITRNLEGSDLKTYLLDIIQTQADSDLKTYLLDIIQTQADSDLKAYLLDITQTQADSDLKAYLLDIPQNQVDSDLKTYLLNIIKDQVDSNKFESVLKSLKNHLKKTRQESNIINSERESCKESFSDLTKIQKKVLTDKYNRIQTLLKREPELLYSAIILEEVEQNPERDEELFSFAAKNLIESKISPSLVNDERSSLLHMAVIKNEPGMVQLLLEAGADPFLRDLNGMSALRLAKEEGRAGILYNMFKFLKKKPSEEKMEREGIYSICFNPSAPFYQMAGWEQTKSGSLSVEYQASSIWKLFIVVKGELDVQVVEQVLPYLNPNQHFLSRVSAYFSRSPEEFVKKIIECYERLYNCYKDNDVESFRQYLNHTDLPEGDFFEGFKVFVNMQTYNTRQVNRDFNEQYNQEIEEMQLALRESNTQIVMLENVVEVQAREVVELNNDNLQLKKQYIAYKEIAGTLDIIVKQQDDLVHYLYAEKAKNETVIEKLTDEKQGLIHDNQGLTRENQGLTRENQGLNKEIQSLRGEIQGLRSETERQEEQIERVLVKYEKLDAEYLEQMEKYRDVVAENKRLKEENKGYRNQSKTSNDEESHDANERNRLTNENLQLKEKVQSLELKNKDQDSLINILYGTNEYQKVKLEKLTGENKDLLDNNKNLEEGKKYLLERYQELFEKHEKLEEESDDTNENNTGGGPQFF